MPDTPTPPETSVSTWSDIESIRAKYSDESKPCQLCNGSGLEFMPEEMPTECSCCDGTGFVTAREYADCLGFAGYFDDIRTLLSALAITREETLEECAKIARNEQGNGFSMSYKQAAANIEDRIRSLSHTPKEKDTV